MEPIYFETPDAFRDWLAEHHETADDVLVGFHRKATGKPSMTWAESVDEALCYGWIDGKTKRVDEERWAIRFTPRRIGSNWSLVNVRNVERLIGEGRMRPAGLRAYEARKASRTGQYSYENRPHDLPEPYASEFRRHVAAWDFFQSQAPSYRRTATYWVISAKQEATRSRRLSTLIDDSQAGRRVAALTPPGRKPYPA